MVLLDLLLETSVIISSRYANGNNSAGVLSLMVEEPISCTKGVYLNQQGIGACDDIGTGKFRLSGGEEVTNTTTAITRGYKAGYNIIQTAGARERLMRKRWKWCYRWEKVVLDSSPLNSGGGGGGYTDGSVTVVDTRLGGSTGDAKVVLRLQT